MGADDELVRLRAEVERLTQGSAWRERILDFVMAAEADGTIKDLIDDQVRKRHEDLCRIEDRYIEVSEALRNANLVVRDAKVFYFDGDDERPIEDLLNIVSAER